MSTVSDPTYVAPLREAPEAPAHAPTSSIPDAATSAPGRLGRAWRGRADDPAWVHPTLLALLLGTAVLYLWDLSASGWANAFYSAAVQAGSQDWTAFLFGSSDAANLITVDKPPASLWVMALSVRVFGLSSWSILVPQALMGVASVGLVYVTVRRWFTPAAGLIAGLALALTPVATLMFRFNNPDALLVLLLTAAAYTTVRATEKASMKWLVWTGVLVGFAFLTKSLQAFLPLPAFALAYLVAAPTTIGRRIRDLLVAGAAMVVAGGWWVALVELWPADSRPYIGGSQTNSAWELIMGYNGLGRITGDEVGSVGGNGGNWGATGWDRLFNASYGGQIAWLIPAALIMAAAMLWMTRRAPRTDRVRAATIIWLGWLLVTGVVISFAQGIIHEYYTVALAPAIAALVGMGAAMLWKQRASAAARITLAISVAVTAFWASVLLARSSDFLPGLRWAVLIGGTAAALAILVVDRMGRRAALAVAGTALITAMLAPAAYSVQTASTAHTGSLPTAGPTVAGGRGGPGGMGGGPGGGFGPQGGTGTQGQTGLLPSFGGGGQGQGPGGMGGTGGGGGMGGLINGTTPSAELQAYLTQDAGSYTWIAATTGAQNAAGYQLATGYPVMSLGGFNGSDPWPTLEVFQQYVAEGQVHYFVGGGGFGGQMGGSSATSEIASWVEQSFASTTVDGVTVYDLTAPLSGGAGASGSAETGV
ncbi:MAG: glycosyltransferase family 39 protein [Actinobacteria bacterium]|nr:glycosyltransferase family 39 protein [Actinomycetota bacterium]